MIYNQKHAVRFKQSNSLSCPMCSCQDSALHILSGCQHPIIRNMVTERRNIAGRLITKAISKGCNISSQNHQNHPNDQGSTLRSGRRVVSGRGHGSLAAATAAGGRPPSPATAYRPRQTHPENLPWQRRTTHLIEIKCENTRPEQQLQAAHAQHGHLRRSIAGNHVLHVILLGVGGVIHIPHTLVPLKSLDKE